MTEGDLEPEGDKVRVTLWLPRALVERYEHLAPVLVAGTRGQLMRLALQEWITQRERRRRPG